MKPFSTFISAFLILAGVLHALSWAPGGEPKMVSENNQLSVTFAVTESTDVEVAIVDTLAGKIVRHLAAGKLGSNPPAPLAANSLSQTLAWDKLDDFGVSVDNSTSCAVRVRAGIDVRLDNMLRPKDGCYFPFNALGTTTIAYINGYLYAFGNITSTGYHEISPHTLRQFAVEGDSLRYLKTLYPSPANLSSSEASPFGIILRDDGTYSPKLTWLTMLATGDDVFSHKLTTILPFGIGGSVVATLPFTTYGKSRIINPDGSAGLAFNILTSPAMPDLNGDLVPDFGGTAYYSSAPDSQYYYLSGIFGGLNGNPMDTGFWRDGGVFKVNRLTGAATRWLSTDPVPNLFADSLRQANVQWYYPAIMGTCADNQGRVFVCDRLHRRIGVYDTLANLIDTLAIPFADKVIFDEPTGSLYVLTTNSATTSGYGPAYTLMKFNNWPSIRTPAWSQAIPDRGYITTMEMHPSIAVMPCNGKNLIAVSVHSILLYRDDDAGLTLVHDYGINREQTPDNGSFDRPLFVDKSKETVYFGNSSNGLYKVTDWQNPKALSCTTSTGEFLMALDATISPDNKYLYLVKPWKSDRFNGQLVRFSTDDKPVAVNYPNTDTNFIRPNIVGRLGSGIVLGGLGVHPRDNRVAVIPDITWTVGYPAYEPGGPTGGIYDVTKVFMYQDTGSNIGANGEFADTLFEIKPGGTGGGILASPRFDMQGNLYVGCAIWNGNTGRSTPLPNHIAPTGYENDIAYQWGKTVIARIPAGNRATIDFNSTATDLEVSNGGRIFNKAVMMQSGQNTGFCNCRSGSFDVDFYGRLFVPNAVTGRVTILDNNDNVIKEFGQYGNVDSWGPESPVPGPDIPMMTPVAAASSDNYVYVADILNTRLIRTRMDFELNNMPGFDPTTGVAGAAVGAFRETPLRITATPNPSYAATRISFVLGQRTPVRLAVYSLNGQLVKTIANGLYNSGKQALSWNGHDSQGKASSTGVYLVRLTTGNKVFTTRIVLAK